MKAIPAVLAFLVAAMHTANAATNCAPIRTVEEANRIAGEGRRHHMDFDLTGTMLSDSRMHDAKVSSCIFFDGSDGTEVFSSMSTALLRGRSIARIPESRIANRLLWHDVDMVTIISARH